MKRMERKSFAAIVVLFGYLEKNRSKGSAGLRGNLFLNLFLMMF